jgi:hypothetical protein
MMCEVAQRFAGWLGLATSIQLALEYVFARWDGKGFPNVADDGIPLPMRLLHVARDFSVFLSAAGADEARPVVERRAGAAHEPRLAEACASRHGPPLGARVLFGRVAALADGSGIAFALREKGHRPGRDPRTP